LGCLAVVELFKLTGEAGTLILTIALHLDSRSGPPRRGGAESRPTRCERLGGLVGGCCRDGCPFPRQPAPFSLKIRSLADSSAGLVPWAWGINAFASVGGSVMAVMVAMTRGFQAVLLAAAACYLVAFLVHLNRTPAPAVTPRPGALLAD
jgi:hypothetical protein